MTKDEEKHNKPRVRNLASIMSLGVAAAVIGGLDYRRDPEISVGGIFHEGYDEWPDIITRGRPAPVIVGRGGAKSHHPPPNPRAERRKMLKVREMQKRKAARKVKK